MSGKTVKMYGLTKAVRGGATFYDKSTSEYNAKMKYLSASIFGDYKKPIEHHKDKKLVRTLSGRPLSDRPEIVHYYPPHEEVASLMRKLRSYGLFRDEHQDFVDEMERLRKLRGKSRFDWKLKWYKPKDEEEK